MNARQRQSGVESGAALLSALIVVAMVATICSAALWRQWRGVEVEQSEREREQAALLLDGATRWAQLLLAEDAKAGVVDHLGEPWAVPLAQARLSRFLAADDEGSEVLDTYLSGQIVDLQSRMNAYELTLPGSGSAALLGPWRRLFRLLGLPENQLNILAGRLRAAAVPRPTDNAPLLPSRYDDLGELGLGPATLEQLRPFVTWLPERTPVNLNTAGAEVLSASLDVDMGDALRLVQGRRNTVFRDIGDVGPYLPAGAPAPDTGRFSTGTRYFEIRVRIKGTRQAVERHTIVVREPEGSRRLSAVQRGMTVAPTDLPER